MDGLIKGANVKVCMHDGCKRTTVVDCVPQALQDYFEKTDFSALSDAERQRVLGGMLVFYCLEHAPEHGYCWQCGTKNVFAAGVDGKINNGLCPACYIAWRKDVLGIDGVDGGNKNGGNAASAMMAAV